MQEKIEKIPVHFSSFKFGVKNVIKEWVTYCSVQCRQEMKQIDVKLLTPLDVDLRSIQEAVQADLLLLRFSSYFLFFVAFCSLTTFLHKYKFSSW